LYHGILTGVRKNKDSIHFWFISSHDKMDAILPISVKLNLGMTKLKILLTVTLEKTLFVGCLESTLFVHNVDNFLVA